MAIDMNHDVLELINLMQSRGVKPREVAFVAVLSACWKRD
jgi:hypothetical protein